MKTGYETADVCRICKSFDIHEVLDLGEQAPANSLQDSENSSEIQVPLIFKFCKNCHTAQLQDNIAPEALFKDYVWVTGTSYVANQYRAVFANNVIAKSLLDNPYIIEVASNDGTFLQTFKENGFDIIGIDPARNIAETAINNSIPTMIEFFSASVARKLDDILPKRPKIVIARNVIPHVPNITSVLEGIKHLLAENGVGVIEFHNSALLPEQLQYDYIYHEHVFYFTLTSISNILKLFDLEIFDLFESPISGGSHVVLFSNKANKRAPSKELQTALAHEQTLGLSDLATWQTFATEVEAHRDKLTTLIKDLKGDVVGYGASARSSTLLNYCNLTSDDIKFIIDKNPLKQKRWTAGSKIEIVSFDFGIEHIDPNDTILLLAWNFRDEIIDELRSCGIRNNIITPFPIEPLYVED